MTYNTRNRTRNDTQSQGSAFHELVVLPTLAPHLARPYRVPGTDVTYNTEFSGQTQAPADTQSDVPEPNTGDLEAETQQEHAVERTAGQLTSNSLNVALDRKFSLYVTLLWLEKQLPTARNGKARAPKQNSRTKVHSLPIPALRCSRAEFVQAILTSHGLQNRFQAHSQSGPDFQISWKGSVGGKSAAPTIQVDEDWKKVCEDLARQPFSRVVDLSVTLDSGCLSPRFEKIQVGSLPNELDNDEEVVPSTKACVNNKDALTQLTVTQVPEVEDFSQDTQILAGIIDDLKAEWNCATDGPCYVMSNGQHVPLSKFRLSGWASEIRAGRGGVKDPPSSALLTHWKVMPSPTTKPRGRTGPTTVTDTISTTSTVDPVTAMFTVMAPLVTTLVAQQLKSISGPAVPSTPRHRSKREASPASPSSHSPKRARHSRQRQRSVSLRAVSLSPLPSRPSSPLPGVEHELESCILAFGKSKALADNIVGSAIENLSALGYTPDVLADDDISNERVGQVSGLPEGTVSALRKFSRKWCTQLEAKKAQMAK